MTQTDLDDEPDVPISGALAQVPTTIDELAALRGEAPAFIEARGKVLATARSAFVLLTHPRDYVLFKAPPDAGGAVTAFLDDAGCRRGRDVFGIESFDVQRPEKIAGKDPGSFMYIVTGCGRCKLTGQTIEGIEGARISTDPVFKGLEGVELELAVRRAARANFEGNIVRGLAGLKNIPVEYLTAMWAGTGKSVEQCPKGKGFGTSDERLGARSTTAPTVPPPNCDVCKTVMVYKATGPRGPFYYCPKFNDHKDRRSIVDAASWIAKHQPTTEPAPAAAADNGATRPAPDAMCSICGVAHVDHGQADHDWEG